MVGRCLVVPGVAQIDPWQDKATKPILPSSQPNHRSITAVGKSMDYRLVPNFIINKGDVVADNYVSSNPPLLSRTICYVGPNILNRKGRLILSNHLAGGPGLFMPLRVLTYTAFPSVPNSAAKSAITLPTILSHRPQ